MQDDAKLQDFYENFNVFALKYNIFRFIVQIICPETLLSVEFVDGISKVSKILLYFFVNLHIFANFYLERVRADR